MPKSQQMQRTIILSDVSAEVDGFLLDRQARGLSPGTLRFYRQKLVHLAAFLAKHEITAIEAVTANHLRQLLVEFARTHNPGGTHALYSALKAFFTWYGDEAEPQDWRDPMRRITAPRVPHEPLEPVSIATVKAMLDTCLSHRELDCRDKALILCLLDTGCRASEIRALTIGDLDMHSGSVLVRRGKGGKARTVFVGAKSRRALIAYLRHRRDAGEADPLFATDKGGLLAYETLRGIIRDRAARAGVEPPTLHDFRRAFALYSLRNGADVYSLQRLMGHSDLQVLRRYLAQTDADLAEAHRRSGPVDNAL